MIYYPPDRRPTRRYLLAPVPAPVDPRYGRLVTMWTQHDGHVRSVVLADRTRRLAALHMRRHQSKRDRLDLLVAAQYREMAPEHRQTLHLRLAGMNDHLRRVQGHQLTTPGETQRNDERRTLATYHRVFTSWAFPSRAVTVRTGHERRAERRAADRAKGEKRTPTGAVLGANMVTDAAAVRSALTGPGVWQLASGGVLAHRDGRVWYSAGMTSHREPGTERALLVWITRQRATAAAARAAAAAAGESARAEMVAAIAEA